MALFNSFQFGDVDSTDYGVYISGDSVYDSPARSVDLVQVPGRNGALALDNGYYENIEVTYPAGSFGTSQEEWREKMLGIRNALAAQRGYQRLIDTYHPEHYRLGMFFAGISATPVQYNRAGQFPIKFNCKPQRFLISGDEAVEFTAEGQEEVYGPSSIASFEAEEGAEIRQLEVDLEPVQDLNGYDNPWPAGGGKNKFNSAAATTNTFSRSGDTFTNTATDTRTVTQLQFQAYNENTLVSYISSTAFTGTYPERVRGSITISEAVTRLRLKHNGQTRDLFLDIPWTAQGTFEVSFLMPNSDPTTVGGLVIEDIMLTADGSYTPYAPYSNICPISGHTEVNVYRAGKNILVPSLYEDNKYQNGSNYGYAISNNNSFWITGYQTVKPSTKYTALLANSGTTVIAFYDKDKNAVGGVNATGSSSTFTTTATTKYINYAVRKTDKAFGEYLEVVEGDTLQNAPITAATYSIPLGQTVYGGTLNVTSGVLTIDRAMVDLGTRTWTKASPRFYTVFATTAANCPKAAASDLTYVANAVCSQYKVTSRAQIANRDNSFSIHNAGVTTYITIVDSRYTSEDAAAFMTAMSGVQLCYELATPTTVQLTPSAVSALLGQNNIWSDAGEVEVKVASPVDLTNPTNFPAKPLIRVYGNGSVQVGDTIATVQNNADGYVDIDCEAMNCYDTTGGRNADVSFSGNDFPELASGDNGILLTGPSKVEITPRWWEL